jgi:predicted HicB family RNase H-like nuclease
MRDARITIRVPQDLYEQAKAKAKREDITLSQILRRALREWVKDPPEEGGK